MSKQIKNKLLEWQPFYDWLPLFLLPFKNPGKSKIKKKKKLKKISFNITPKFESMNKAPRSLFYQPLTSSLLMIAGIAGLLYFGLISDDTVDLKPDSEYSIQIPAATGLIKEKGVGLEPSKPLSLNIPSLEINVPVKEVGKNADGTLEVPPLFEKITGWYKFGPTPGEVGPAIIVGHVDTYKGPSVFWRLRELKPGDIVEVTREDGKIVKFSVDGLEQFEQDKFPTEKVYGDIDHSGLRLITCGGTFNKKTQRYSKNTVVFATLIDKEA